MIAVLDPSDENAKSTARTIPEIGGVAGQSFPTLMGVIAGWTIASQFPGSEPEPYPPGPATIGPVTPRWCRRTAPPPGPGNMRHAIDGVNGASRADGLRNVGNLSVALTWPLAASTTRTSAVRKRLTSRLSPSLTMSRRSVGKENVRTAEAPAAAGN